ncbi:MAG: NAD(P)/FAD-dependent oxidoreductase [Deltaproteobacteria bacterium]|nr:NAD(P)/FAD-dependent oxidoreductase [Deltaproteobacteria bacterium]
MMSQKWDIIIVGAGMGGLTAAAFLAKAGLHVLVLDRNPHPGGTAYAYHRKGFAFPMGPLGFSHPEFIQETLNHLEVGENLTFSRVHYQLRAFDLDIPLSLPFDEMGRELTRIFPSEAEGLEKFFKNLRGMNPFSHLPTHESSDISASEYLHHLVKDWRLRRILGSIGTREPYSGLPLLVAMWNLMGSRGIWYPKEGMQLFCDRLVRAVKRNFGEIRLGAEVAKIRVDKEKVLGVTLKDASEMNSELIISNADYKSTFIKLIDSDAVPPEWFQAISNAHQTNSIFQVCLGVDSDKADLSAFKKAGRVIYRGHQENGQEKESLNWNAQEIDLEAFTTQELEVSLWGKDWDMLSSDGKASIVIRTEAEYNHFSNYRLGWRKRSPKYQEYKTRLAQALIREVDHLIPGLEKAVIVMDVATPLTFEDQGGRSEGAVAGWSWDYDDFREDQPKELIRTPIKGLYMAGYQAFSALFMGGVPTAMESGKRAAEAVMEGSGPIKSILFPGAK